MPRLILQPVLENAFEHGLRDVLGDGFLCLSYRREAEWLYIQVANNGADVFLARYDYRDHRHPIPEILYFNTPFFAVKASGDAVPLRTVGLFNVEETDKEIKLAPEDLKLPVGKYILTDVWTGRIFDFSREVAVPVVAHGSCLLAVNQACGQQLLDSNVGAWEVHGERQGEALRLTMAVRYRQGEAQLLFAKPPRQVSLALNGRPLDFSLNGNAMLFQVSSPGELALELKD